MAGRSAGPIVNSNHMPCRCAERGHHIVAATKAAMLGNTKAMVEHIARAAHTVRADISDLIHAHTPAHAPGHPARAQQTAASPG